MHPRVMELTQPWTSKNRWARSISWASAQVGKPYVRKNASISGQSVGTSPVLIKPSKSACAAAGPWLLKTDSMRASTGGSPSLMTWSSTPGGERSSGGTVGKHATTGHAGVGDVSRCQPGERHWPVVGQGRRAIWSHDARRLDDTGERRHV